jgi:signal transduction histidine kinase/CheY-like chemotaxis protein
MTRERILILTEDAQEAAFLQARLGEEGYEVEAASPGPDLLGLCSRTRPDLLLVSATIPGLPGRDLIAGLRIRKLHRPVILLTAPHDPRAALGAVQAGARSHVPRPLDLVQVIERVDEVLEEDRSRPLRSTEGPALLRTTGRARRVCLAWRLFLLVAVATLFIAYGEVSLSAPGLAALLLLYGLLAVAYSCLPHVRFLSFYRSNHGFLPDYLFLGACLLVVAGRPSELSILLVLAVTLGLTTRDWEGLCMYVPLTWLFAFAAHCRIEHPAAVVGGRYIWFMGLTTLVALVSFGATYLEGYLARRRERRGAPRGLPRRLVRAERRHRQALLRLEEAMVHPGPECRSITPRLAAQLRAMGESRIRAAHEELGRAYEEATARADALARLLPARTARAVAPLHPTPAPVELTVVVDALVARLLPLAQEHEVTLESRVSPGTRLLTDRDLLEELLTELLTNAIRYNRPGGKVHVKADDGLEQEEAGTVLRVEDTGMGLTPQDLSQVMAWCFRGEEARRLHPMGLGLGLYQARRLAEALGGTLTLQSTAGTGTRARLVLPLRSQGH